MVPYAPRAHTASWQLVHALAGLASHAAWHTLPELANDFEIVNEVAASYEELTGETFAQAKRHIPKAVDELEQPFGVRVE